MPRALGHRHLIGGGAAAARALDAAWAAVFSAMVSRMLELASIALA